MKVYHVVETHTHQTCIVYRYQNGIAFNLQLNALFERKLKYYRLLDKQSWQQQQLQQPCVLC